MEEVRQTSGTVIVLPESDERVPPPDVRSPHPSGEAASGRGLRQGPRTSGAAAGGSAGLVVPPQLQRGRDQQVGSGSEPAAVGFPRVTVFVPAGGSPPSLCPSRTWPRSNPSCSPNTSSGSWRSSASAKVRRRVSWCLLVLTLTSSLWARTVSQRSAPEEAGLLTLPDVQEVRGGEFCLLPPHDSS